MTEVPINQTVNRSLLQVQPVLMACGSGNTFYHLKSGWAEIRVRRTAAWFQQENHISAIERKFYAELKEIFFDAIYLAFTCSRKSEFSEIEMCFFGGAEEGHGTHIRR